MSDIQPVPHDIRVVGERESAMITIDGEDIPVRYVDGRYIAILHSYVPQPSPQELAEHVARDVLDMRRS